MNNKPINFGVLGAHNRGKISLLLHRPDQGLRVTAICAAQEQGLEEYYEKCGPKVFFSKDYREILTRADVDVVLVCTPDHLHAEHAIAALNAGKDVFLEKPMGITIPECDAIIEAAKLKKAKLYVGHNMRFFPMVQKMKQLIDAGRIGRVEAIWCRHFISYGGDSYFKDWHSERKNTTGLLLQKGAHDIDIIHYLAGGYTRRVVGMGKLSVYNETQHRRKPDEVVPTKFGMNENWPPLSNKGFSPNIDVEDHSMIMMQLDNGVQASYHQCHYTPDDCRNYTVIGTEGRLENYGDYSTSTRLCTIHLWNCRMGYMEHGNEVFRIPNTPGSHGGADPSLMEDFVNFLRTGERKGASIKDARMSVATGCLGTESLRNNSSALDIPALDL